MLDHAGGGEGGNAPALAFLVEQIRWTTHGDRGQQLFLTTPGLAAATVGAHRDIGDQADLHARFPALRLGRGQPLAGQPLGKGIELHVLGMAFGELGHGRIPGIAILLGPMLPAGRGIALSEGGMQGFEAAMVFQSIATVAAEGLEALAQLTAGSAEVQVQGAQQAQTQLCQSRPIDQLQSLQALGFRLQAGALHGLADGLGAEDQLRRGVEHVEEHPTRRGVGAVATAVGAEHCMQRTDGQGVGALVACGLGKMHQALQITGAAAPFAPEAVELHGQPPETGLLVTGGVGDGEAAFRRNGQGQGFAIDLGLVITGGADRRQLSAVVDLTVQTLAVFQLHLVADATLELVRRPDRLADHRRDERRQMVLVAHLGQLAQAGVDLVVTVRRQLDGFEQIAQRLGAHPLALAVVGGPFDGDARGLRQLFQTISTHAFFSSQTSAE